MLLLFVTLTLSTLTLVAGDQCAFDESYLVSPLSEAYNHDQYKFFEAGLQIFTTYKIPCDGVLTHWSYMTPHSTCGAVNLAVFRERVDSTPNNRTFEIVGESRIINEADANTWVTVSAPTPIDVQTGDLLGLYYDIFHTVQTDVVIPSISEKWVNKSDTLVYLLDATGVQSGVVTGGYEIRQRIPALSATVTQPSQPPTFDPTTFEPTTFEPITFEPITFEPITFEPEPPPLTTEWMSTNVETTEEVPITIAITTTTTTASPPPPLSRCFLPRPMELFSVKCIWPAWRAFFDHVKGSCVIFYGCAASDYSNNFDTLGMCRQECPEVAALVTPKPTVKPTPVERVTTAAMRTSLPVTLLYVPQLHIQPSMNVPVVLAPEPTVPPFQQQRPYNPAWLPQYLMGQFGNNNNNWPNWNRNTKPNTNTNFNNLNRLGNTFGNFPFPQRW